MGAVLPGPAYLRIRKEYTSTHANADDPAGPTITVPGIILAADTHVMRTEGIMVDALLGEGDALDAYSHGLQDEAVAARRLANVAAELEHERHRLAARIIEQKDAEAAKLLALLYPPSPAPFAPPPAGGGQ